MTYFVQEIGKYKKEIFADKNEAYDYIYKTFGPEFGCDTPYGETVEEFRNMIDETDTRVVELW